MRIEYNKPDQDRLESVYRIWRPIGLVLSNVATPIIMAALFFLIFMPIGLVRRFFGKDRLKRSYDESKTSYRLQPNKENVEDPF